MRAWLLSMLLCACSFEHGRLLAGSDATMEGDAATPDAPPPCASFSSQFDTCALEPSGQDLVLTGQNTYDTATGTLTAGSTTLAVARVQLLGKEGPLEVVVVRDFRMSPNARLRAIGPLPLAILAFGAIRLDSSAQLDVAAGGAGARSSCAGGAIPGMPQNGGAGGGGGGGFAAAGGNGGNGDADAQTQAPGGPGGAPATAKPLGPLGGCPGARGGNGADGGGAGGAGGGALYLVSATGVEVAAGASINAGGGGGKGGGISAFSYGDAGGGGGGSGGMILIEAPVVRSAGALAANGGGGGEASGNGSGGNDGAPGGVTTMPAAGGQGNSASGTDGGSGGAQASPAGASVTNVQNGGGGGGGGSVGYIIVVSPDAMLAMASPDPS